MGASAAFADPNAGTGNKTVNFSGYALSGTDAGDYSLAQPNISTGTINTRAITLTAGNQSQTYGSIALGTSDFSLTSGTYASGQAATGVTLAATDINSLGTSGSGNDNVGTWKISESNATGSGGFTASNYNITYTPGTLTIGELGLTLTGLTASKTYDGSDTGGITIGGTPALGTPITNDNVGVNASGASAGFTDPNAGTGNKTVNFSGYALSGTDAGDYSLTQPSITNGTVSTRAITLTAGNQSQTYGSIALGTSDFSLTSGSYASGQTATGVTLAATDINSLGTSASGNDNAGTWKISESNATGTGGFTASNYNVTYTPGTLTINSATLNATVQNQNLAYGTVTPTLSASNSSDVNWSGFAAGDNASNALSSTTFTYGGATPGLVDSLGNYTLSISGITARNYNLGSVTLGTLNITSSVPVVSTPSSDLPSSVIFAIGSFPVLANNLGNTQYAPHHSIEETEGCSSGNPQHDCLLITIAAPYYQ